MSNLLSTSSPDPLTLVYCAGWDTLENHTGFTGLVSPPNRIKFVGDPMKALKELITDSDLPEVCIDPSGGDIHLQATSSHSLLALGFEVWAATGNQRLDTLGPTGINGAIFPVVWETLRAMLGWTATLRALTYGGNPLVHLAKPTSLAISLTNADENRQIIGWSAKIHYEVHMNFLSSAIMPTPPTD